MKRLAFLLFFFGLTHSGIAQEKYFHELKGMEDSSGTTHLFYRLYQGTVNEGRSFLSENHVYHYNSLLESDSILFKSGIDYTGLSYFSLTADYSFPDKDIQRAFHLNNTDDVFGNVYSFLKSANGSFFDAGLSWGDKIRTGYNDTLSFSISNLHQKSVLVITDNDSLPSVRYNYAILVKAHENEKICDAFANCDLGASDSVLFFHYNFLEIDNKTNRIFFSRNDSLFVSHDLGSSFLFLNDQFKWGEFQHFIFADDETTL
ncbi:MAG: hypothetical protein MI700_12110, partial [Balneolales bacterium]|nr:hypothetical protein [Balneolales bacterium]